MDINNVMIISPVDHSSLLPVLAVVLLASIMVYQIIRIVITLRRRKILYDTAGLIIDGHDTLMAERKIVTIDGEALSNEFVHKQIEKNNAKIDKIRKKVHPETNYMDTTPETRKAKKKKKQKKQDVLASSPKTEAAVSGVAREAQRDSLEKQKKSRKSTDQTGTAEGKLNTMYTEDDLFYDALSAYYDTKLPEITDPTVKAKIMKNVRKKNCKTGKKPESLDGYSVFE